MELRQLSPYDCVGYLDERRVEMLDGVIVEMPLSESIPEEIGDKAAEHFREQLGYRAQVREYTAKP